MTNSPLERGARRAGCVAIKFITRITTHPVAWWRHPSLEGNNKQTMKSLQETFNQIQEIKKKQKDLRSAYKEALERVVSHKEAVEAIKALREKKVKLEDEVKLEFSKEFDKLDELKIELEEANMMLTDIAISELMKGKTVEITDQKDNIYEPSFAVSFKKTMSGSVSNHVDSRPSQDKAVAKDIPEINLF